MGGRAIDGYLPKLGGGGACGREYVRRDSRARGVGGDRCARVARRVLYHLARARLSRH